MHIIKVANNIKSICPDFVGVAICSKVKNSQFNEVLWEQVKKETEAYKDNNTLEDIKKNPVIAATRKAYKQMGKDPNRYRPSAEALCRRIVRGLPLHQIDTLVDLVNLVSIKTGYSIGGFDANKIQGNTLILGIGENNEPYEAIGRGVMNIEGLPVYRDEIGGIGTPTSDHERTKVSLETTHFLTIINGYNGEDGIEEAVWFMQSLLKQYAGAENEEVIYF